MTAATQDILTDRYGTPDQAPEPAAPPMGANVIIFGGTVPVMRAGYLLDPVSSPVSTDIVLGICSKQTDNRTTSFYGGAAGAVTCPVDRGTFWLSFGSGADAFAATDANFNTTAYLIDNATVGKTNGSNTRPVAGIVKAFDAAQSKVAVALATNAGVIF